MWIASLRDAKKRTDSLCEITTPIIPELSTIVLHHKSGHVLPVLHGAQGMFLCIVMLKFMFL